MSSMPRWMLDTNIASYAIKHRAGIAERLARLDPADVCLSAAAVAELFYGLQDLPKTHSLWERVPAFIDRIQVVSWDSDAAQVHAVLRHRLLSVGQPIGEMDMMIAAHAISLGMTLVTHNTRHFLRVSPPLRIANWVEPGLD